MSLHGHFSKSACSGSCIVLIQSWLKAILGNIKVTHLADDFAVLSEILVKFVAAFVTFTVKQNPWILRSPGPRT